MSHPSAVEVVESFFGSTWPVSGEVLLRMGRVARADTEADSVDDDFYDASVVLSALSHQKSSI